MATFDLLVDPRRSQAFYIALNMALFYLGNAMPDTAVHVKVATPKSYDGSLPHQLSVVIQDDSGWETDVVLNRVQYIEPNIPVYTYCGAHKGGSDYQLVELDDNQNVAYYQSADHKAAIQVTKVDSPEQQIDFLLNGELVVNGTRCSLTHGDEAKRDLSASDDLVYTLHELPSLPGIIDDVFDSQSHEAEEFPARDFSSSGRLSKTLFSRNTQYGASDIYVDVVAVADNALYLRYFNHYGSKQQAVQKMRERYTSTFNSVDAIYQSTSGLQHSIHVRLVKLHVEVTSTSQFSTEPFLTGYGSWLEASKALAAFEYYATNYPNSFYPYDHLMFFTGYDMMTTEHGDVIGLAKVYVCSKNSITLCEDTNQSDLAKLAAHELGHALSAYHDGQYQLNSCNPTSDIMAARAGTYQTKFSSCSAYYFNNFINGMLQSWEGQKCLLQQLPARSRRSSL